MAISLRDLQTAGVEAIVQNLEAEIDRKLSKRNLQPGVTFIYDLPPTATPAVIDKLRGKYVAQGWEVQYHEGNGNKHDPTDALHFKYLER